jgi:hypothetical protein
MPEAALHIVSMLVSFAVVMVLFAMMFKWLLPDVSVGWRDVWLGAFLTALFFEVGKAAIGFYIGKQGLELTAAPKGSLRRWRRHDFGPFGDAAQRVRVAGVRKRPVARLGREIGPRIE